MNKRLLLSIGILGCLVQSASAVLSLYTTANDFAQFNGGAGTASTTYYSDSSTMNGIGNGTSGAGGVGSLQLTAGSGWNGWVADFPGATAAFMSAIDPGGIRPWSPESGWGAGSLTAHSGTILFDLYRGNLTDWNGWGVNFSYNGYWGPFWATSSTDFIGADGRTWTRFEVPYTINLTTNLTYFGMALAQNAGTIEGQTFFVDNFQIVPVPEPAATGAIAAGALMLCGAVKIYLRRRQS